MCRSQRMAEAGRWIWFLLVWDWSLFAAELFLGCGFRFQGCFRPLSQGASCCFCGGLYGGIASSREFFGADVVAVFTEQLADFRF